jgi:hypothetical protein
VACDQSTKGWPDLAIFTVCPAWFTDEAVDANVQMGPGLSSPACCVARGVGRQAARDHTGHWYHRGDGNRQQDRADHDRGCDHERAEQKNAKIRPPFGITTKSVFVFTQAKPLDTRYPRGAPASGMDVGRDPVHNHRVSNGLAATTS